MSERDRRALEQDKKRQYAAELQQQMPPPPRARGGGAGNQRREASFQVGVSDEERRALEADKKRQYALELQEQMQQSALGKHAARMQDHTGPVGGGDFFAPKRVAPPREPQRSPSVDEDGDDPYDVEGFARALGLRPVPVASLPAAPPVSWTPPLSQHYDAPLLVQQQLHEQQHARQQHQLQQQQQQQQRGAGGALSNFGGAVDDKSTAEAKKAAYREYLAQQVEEAKIRKERDKKLRDLDDSKAEAEARVQVRQGYFLLHVSL